MIDGHAYAAGYMFACAHDFRFLREDFGSICVSEISIGAVVPRGMIELMKSKLKPQVIRDLVSFGIIFEGKKCKELGLVDQVVP